MPKAKKKLKHLENKGGEEKGEERDKKNVGEEIQEKAGKAKRSRTIRFLARLQRALARLTCCTQRRKKSNKEQKPSREVPGPSNIALVDKKVNVTSDRKGKPEDGKDEDQSLKTDGKEKDKLMTSYVEEQIFQHYHQIQHHIYNQETVYIQYYRGDGPEKDKLTTSYVEQQILQHYHQIQHHIYHQETVYIQYYRGDGPEKDKLTTSYVEQQILQHYHHIEHHIYNQETVYIQYYGGQEREMHAGEETEDRGANVTPKTSERQSSSHEEKSDNVCLEEPVAASSHKKEIATVPLTLSCFTFHTLLGSGGFGDVFLATDNIRKEHVALKVVNKRIYTELDYGLAEREILYLSHENHYLVHGLAAFQTRSYVYYVMELATRGNLDDFIEKNGRLDVPTSRFITAEVICGLQFLHNKGIIHHDLKPNNIVLTREGHIKIADFGISVTDVYESTTNRCRGTPAMTAPEMVKCMEYGRGVDFYALGVTLYQMSTGRHPFCASTEVPTTRTLRYPEFLTPETVEILKGLLCKKQPSRLGVKGDIRKHPYFSAVNWNHVENRTAVPPEILLSVPEDLNVTATLCYKEEPYSIDSQKLFENFSFVCPAWSETYHPRPFRKIRTKLLDEPNICSETPGLNN